MDGLVSPRAAVACCSPYFTPGWVLVAPPLRSVGSLTIERVRPMPAAGAKLRSAPAFPLIPAVDGLEVEFL